MEKSSSYSFLTATEVHIGTLTGAKLTVNQSVLAGQLLVRDQLICFIVYFTEMRRSTHAPMSADAVRSSATSYGDSLAFVTAFEPPTTLAASAS